MSAGALIANAAWFAASAPERARFIGWARHATAVQARLLSRLVAANAETEFGRAHDFASIRDLEGYRERVPMRTWEELLPWIDRVAAGRPHVLTAEPVRLFEPTGGSAGGAKLVPYTTTLQREFQRAIAVWIADIFATLPRALGGTSYWSISPPAQRLRTTAAGIPIGFAADTEYLGGRARWVRHAMAAPPGLAGVGDADAFLDATMAALLRRSDLALVSVWNPSFLIVLLERFRARPERFVRAIHDGEHWLGLDPSPPDPARAHAIEEAWRGSARPFERIWPRLQLVSCWADAAARPLAKRLRRELPGVRLQGKGLLATEGFVTVPLFAAGGSVPAYRSHVLEFVDDAGRCHGPAGLALGTEYEVVLSTSGGLYRYAIGDRVRVTGQYAGLARLEFIGRALTSDLVGEKLDARHVQRVLDQALAHAGVRPDFAMIAPEHEAGRRGYALFIEARDGADGDGRWPRLRDAVETGLRDNVQYAHARHMGQLDPLRMVRIERDGLATYLRRSALEGQAMGDVKPTALDRRMAWTRWFAGDIVPPRIEHFERAPVTGGGAT